MTPDLEPTQVEIIGKCWLISEAVRIGLEPSNPLRDNDGVDLILSAPEYDWTTPIQVKSARGRSINVFQKYARGTCLQLPLLVVYTLLGDHQAPLPASAEDVYLRRHNDYSSRMLVLTGTEAWALPTISGKSDADPEHGRHHRLSWKSLVDHDHIPSEAVVEYRGQFLAALRAGSQRRYAEMGRVQGTSDISADDSET
jgi:hypothetical protein